MPRIGTTLRCRVALKAPGITAMNECVLIVDDDPVQRRLLENMAQKFGYTAMTAESGEQALRILSAADGRASIAWCSIS